MNRTHSKEARAACEKSQRLVFTGKPKMKPAKKRVAEEEGADAFAVFAQLYTGEVLASKNSLEEVGA